MQAFIMHVGHPGNIDIKFTVTRQRSVTEMLEKLPAGAPERAYFESQSFRKAFPNGHFNCWGVPRRAMPAFEQTRIGDVVLFVPWIGIHDGGIHQIGIVEAKCPVDSLAASRVLWPETPDGRLFPLLFFFNTEAGHRGWFEFLDELGYKENWSPRGYYRRLREERFQPFGGVRGYVERLREKHGFARLGNVA
jgi:hypothetical protein